MEYDELKKLLKIDFPEIKGNEKKVLAACKARERKYNKQLIKLTYFLASFVVLTVIAVLSIVLLNNRVPNEVAEINDAIADLGSIKSDEKRMLEIMEIKKDIQNISADKQKKINMSKLAYETNTTVNHLKNSVEWNGCLNTNNSYVTLENILNHNEIIEISMIKGRYSLLRFISTSTLFNDGLLLLFDLPYIDIIDKSESFQNEYKDVLGTDYNNEYTFYLMDNDESESVVIRVYDSGYVLIWTTNKNSDNAYDIEYKSLFISLLPLEEQNFLKYIGSLKVENVANYFRLCEVFDVDDISLIAIISDISSHMLGTPSTDLRGENLEEYYEKFLEDLVFIDDEEIVREIVKTLGNDYTSININLKNGDSIAIFVSHKDYRYILTHGMTHYAGVGTMEKGLYVR